MAWTEYDVTILEIALGRNLDILRLQHGLPIPERKKENEEIKEDESTYDG